MQKMSLTELKDQYFESFQVDEDPFGLLTDRRYKGAAVEIFERGIHRTDIYHVDVSSMYPIIMIVLNLSPESLTLIKTKPLTGQYILTPTYIEVPDETLKMQLCIKVSEMDSISRKLLSDFYDRRVAVRKEKPQGWYPTQLTLKIIMNSVYGYNGMEWARYGSYLVAIVTAAVGRFIITTALKWLRAHGITPLEMDTDGIYVRGVFNADELTEYIQGKFSAFRLRHKLKLAANKYDGMIVVKMKNYILRYGGKNIIKGSGFHGRKIPRVAEETNELLISALFEGKPLVPTWMGCIEMMFQSPLKDFEMTLELSKAPEEYAEGSIYRKLFDQLPGNVEWGDEIRYVKTTDGYVPLGTKPDAELLAKIDWNYYHGRMKNIAKLLLAPMRDVEQEVATVYNYIYDVEKKRKCEECGVRLNKRVRYLDTSMCMECAR